MLSFNKLLNLIMKKIKINRLVLVSLLSTAIFSGCSESDLDLSNPNLYDVTQITDVNQYIVGIYDTYQKIPANEFTISEMRTDNTSSKSGDGSFAVIDNFSYDENLGEAINYWSNNYTVIRQANIVINLDNPDITNHQLGQAYFMRALAHFNLAVQFQNIGYVTEYINSQDDLRLFPQLTEAETYDLIVEDLLKSVNLLDITSSDQNVYASKGAAKALLAKVYMSKPVPNYVLAKAQLEDMINVSNVYGYSLLESTSYGDIFGSSSDNSEVIFAIQYNADTNPATSNYTDHTTEDNEGDAQEWSQDMTSSGGAQGLNVATEDLVAAVGGLSDEPVRFEFLMYEEGGRFYNNKFRDINVTSDINWIVLRYADVLLMYTEAVMAGDDSTNDALALETFNRVRERAGLLALSNVSKDDLLHERRIEFAYENQRLLDLKRFGVIDQVLGAFSDANSYNYESYKKYLAIPQREIDLLGDFYKQNSGY